MLNLFFNSIYFKSILSSALGFIVLIIFQKDFKFLLNKNHIHITLLVPISILLITQTIATNLYLSLGLIGALSIVRYRTPVKSQFELAYIFILIAIGVITGVNPYYSIFLVVTVFFLSLIYKLLVFMFPMIGTQEISSFGSGSIEVNMTGKIDDYEKINLDKTVARIIRVDFLNDENKFFCLIHFQTMAQASSFKKNLKFKPITLSIANY